MNEELGVEDRTDVSIEELQFDELTTFEWDILVAIARSDDIRPDGMVSGQDVRRVLQPLYPREVNHGRLYPNIDELVSFGLVHKGTIDRRTNGLKLTDKGRELLSKRRLWIRNGPVVFADE